MTYLLLIFGTAPLRPEDIDTATRDGRDSQVCGYVLADDQPVPVHRGLRPGSQYPFMTAVRSAAPPKPSLFTKASPHTGIDASWLYRAITERIERSEGSTGEDHVHLAFTNPAEGREDEFNAWYSGEHMSHALLADGFVSATRYVLEEDRFSDSQTDPSPYRYLTLYGLKTDDLRGSEDDMHRFAIGEKPGMPLSDALGPVRATWVYTPVG